MGGLPEGWSSARLGDLGEWFGGGTPSKRDPAFWEDGDIPWLSPKDMKSERLADVQDRITDRAVTESSVRMVPTNSVAVVTRSGVLEHSVPVALVPFATTLNQDMKAIVAHDGIMPEWIAWTLRRYERRILDGCRKAGTTVASLSTSALMDMQVPVPPLAEQCRIVEALEEQLSRLDQGLYALAKNEIRTRKLIPRVMSAIFDCSGGELKRVDEVGEVRLGRQRSPKNHHGDNMRPYLRAANVGWSGLLLGDVKEMNFSAKEVETYRLHVGDILLSEASGSPGEVGKPALWSDEIEDCCFQNTLIRVRPTGVLPEYLHMYFRCLALRGDFRAGSRGVGIHHLGAAKLAEWSVIVPSEEMQHKLVDSLEETVSALEAASKVFDKDQGLPRRAYALRNALLRKAFNGDLVPQDPSDEPASTLLARIAAEREAAKPVRKAAKRAARSRKATAAVTAAATKTAPAPTPAPSTSVQQELFDQ
ncbi:restriction endonuclease subunit S [Streptomyces triticagri]|uniref:restriction endonuclease subunit S n=1 Tax=Streptomyces triticagri TaxID=2293568 RepID=UPI001F3CE4FE|nr:restriction endonuclease subunit S [Streptomyces triticagri]